MNEDAHDKENTKVIFEDGGNRKTDELMGGMPLSEGEIVHVHLMIQAMQLIMRL